MRITSGIYKGRRIKMPEGIRPSQEKVRKALFDILGEVTDASFLELFAGSGAVGIEALSRGAKTAVFVENNPHCLKALKSNFAFLTPDTYNLLPVDAENAVEKLCRQGRLKFDIIFLDPPYLKAIPLRPETEAGGSPAKKILQMLGACDILARNGFTVIQHSKKESLPEESGSLSLIKQAIYGDTVLSFYKR
ncbi:MAG: 16S rRNA (guanine(966)-N(2))-methyltransferase RsmD [Candidatus Omnitrophica bacterium]|nr:16S rRNA (guanine(966)-N(2))-methyltransferase RsmD [Candidatus Omnitrophota bacterium]MDD5553420.1 16S rRNA (guanine(966)-N(2))-methyltransferase RsmD [Candidatus Omnitrophota bacterium]